MALTIQGYCQGVQSLRSSTTVASSRSHWSGHCHVERVSALYGVLDTLVLSSCTWYTFEWGFIPLSHFQLTFCQWSQQWLYESWSIYGLNILEFIDIPIMQAMEVQPGYRGVLCWRRVNSQAQKVRHDKTDWDDGVGWRVLSFFFQKWNAPKMNNYIWMSNQLLFDIFIMHSRMWHRRLHQLHPRALMMTFGRNVQKQSRHRNNSVRRYLYIIDLYRFSILWVYSCVDPCYNCFDFRIIYIYIDTHLHPHQFLPAACHKNCQVVPDLERLMDSLNNRMSVIYDMISTLEDKENPPPMERYTLHFASKIWFPPSKFTVLSNMRFTWGCMYIYIPLWLKGCDIWSLPWFLCMHICRMM